VELERAPDDSIASSVAANRVRFVFGLVLVTIGAGAFAVACRSSLTAVYQTFYGADDIVDSIARLPRWLRLIVPVAAAAIAGSIARLRSSRTQGVSNVMEAIALGRVQLSLRSTASRVASSWVAIAGGLSIGREGPLIEVGAALGAAVGRIVKTSLTQTRVLVGAGTAAGFAAAYNTPFAASLFVLETIAGIAAPELRFLLWQRRSARPASCAQPSGRAPSTGSAHSASNRMPNSCPSHCLVSRRSRVQGRPRRL
jgi:CIC family chloride channel protein